MKKENEPEKKTDSSSSSEEAAFQRKRAFQAKIEHNKRLAQARLNKPRLSEEDKAIMDRECASALEPLQLKKITVDIGYGIVELNCYEIPHERGIFREDIGPLVETAALLRKDRKISSDSNVAVVRLIHNDGLSSTMVPSGTGVAGVGGHSERLALKDAINKAIADGRPGFIGLRPILEAADLTERGTFDPYRDALRTCLEITIFSDRGPCTRDHEGEKIGNPKDPCERFFARILPNNHKFFYGTPYIRGGGAQMSASVERQSSLALKFLKYRDHERLLGYKNSALSTVSKGPLISPNEEQKPNDEAPIQQLSSQLTTISTASFHWPSNVQSSDLGNSFLSSSLSAARPPYSFRGTSSSSSASATNPPLSFSSSSSSSSTSSAARPPNSSSSGSFLSPNYLGESYKSSNPSLEIEQNKRRALEIKLVNAIRSNQLKAATELVEKLNILSIDETIQAPRNEKLTVQEAINQISNLTYKQLMQLEIERKIKNNIEKSIKPPSSVLSTT